MLSKREREYVYHIINKKPSDNTKQVKSSLQDKKANYDVNYRLKKKFEGLHKDYWLLVSFFKAYEQNFSLRSTKQTKNVLAIAKSQVPNNLSLVRTRCHFCRRDGESIKEKRLLEVFMCDECLKHF